MEQKRSIKTAKTILNQKAYRFDAFVRQGGLQTATPPMGFFYEVLV